MVSAPGPVSSFHITTIEAVFRCQAVVCRRVFPTTGFAGQIDTVGGKFFLDGKRRCRQVFKIKIQDTFFVPTKIN